jgi:hypothetical protein
MGLSSTSSLDKRDLASPSIGTTYGYLKGLTVIRSARSEIVKFQKFHNGISTYDAVTFGL